MRAFLHLLLAGLAALAAAGARAGELTPPDVLVRNVTLEVVDLIAGDGEPRGGGREKLMRLIDARVLPHFDFYAMTAYVTGPSWKKADADQKKRLAGEFKTLLVRTYAGALQAYSNQKFEFRPLRAKPEDSEVLVSVRVLQSGGQPVTIDYRMEKGAEGWKVYDVAVGGVSLVANYRSEFTARLRDGGIDGLIRDLQAKNGGVKSASQ
jgi:phospholipid transport system substrate-binding protein